MKISVFKAIIILTLLFANMHIDKAQTLYAISQDSNNMNFLSKVDPMTGNTTIISSAGLGQYLAQGVSTLDPINKRFFFLSVNDTLYTVDLTTGNLLAKNRGSLLGTYRNYSFEYNCQDTTLYAISQDSNNINFLSKVDPMTGSTTIISSAGLGQYVAQGVSTLDPINKRFFFLSVNDTLFTVDLSTGNLLAKNRGSLLGTYRNYSFEYNCQDTTLYAISQDSNNMNFLSKVDPMTGNTTIISSAGLGQYLAQGVSTLDPINKRFFFLSVNDTLYTVDLTTGNLLAKNRGSLLGTYRNYSFECEKSCSSIPTNQNVDIGDLKIPNAFSPNNDGHNDDFCLQGWMNCIKTFDVNIYDRLGENVYESKNVNFCWNGIYKNKPLDAGVFVYYIKAVSTNGESIFKKGNISLIK